MAATINITLSPTGATPDVVSVHRGDTIIWTPTHHNTITQITFQNQGIFSEGPAPVPGSNTWRGVVRTNSITGRQKYSFVAGGGLIDPVIEIEPHP